MTDPQRDLLLKARTSLDAARLLHGAGFSAFSASRAYYAMFYVLEAFLEAWPHFFQARWGLAAFGQHFARTGRVPSNSPLPLRAMAVRHQATTYYVRGSVPAMPGAIARAEQFVAAGGRLVAVLPPDDGETETSQSWTALPALARITLLLAR
jgi:uncharacterized protein (UPF0332 family)